MKTQLGRWAVVVLLLALGCDDVELPEERNWEDTGTGTDTGTTTIAAVACDETTAEALCGNAALCVDGYCCNTTCAGGCEACDRPGTEGICTLLPKDEICRPLSAEDSCDIAEVCDGDSPKCPADEFLVANDESCSVHGDCCSGHCSLLGLCFTPSNPVIPTGQDFCYTEAAEMDCTTSFPCRQSDGGPDFCGQDAQYPENERKFTATTTGGKRLVTDSLTGLMWQGCPKGQSGPDCATGDAEIMNWDSADEYCEELTYGGYSNWRLPSAHELLGIIDYGEYDPSINEGAFPVTPSDFFWSSLATGTTAWRVNFLDGYIYHYWKNQSENRVRVRCVHNGPYDPPTTDRFEEGDKLVLDLAFDLMWQKEYDDTSKTWKQALAYCEGLDYGGHDDWRLPNINELSTLFQRYLPDESFLPGMDSYFWSSSSHIQQNDSAWYIDFGPEDRTAAGTGRADDLPKTSSCNARCVRGGQF